jgi:hypothetical protein
MTGSGKLKYTEKTIQQYYSSITEPACINCPGIYTVTANVLTSDTANWYHFLHFKCSLEKCNKSHKHQDLLVQRC